MRIVNLEDNSDRQLATRKCLTRRLPDARIEFYDSAHAFISSLTLAADDVELIALDHDLEMIDSGDGTLVDPGTGMDAAEWLAQSSLETPFIVHTTNLPAGERMMSTLQNAGWSVQRVVPYGDTEWIREVWWQAVCRAISPDDKPPSDPKAK